MEVVAVACHTPMLTRKLAAQALRKAWFGRGQTDVNRQTYSEAHRRK